MKLEPGQIIMFKGLVLCNIDFSFRSLYYFAVMGYTDAKAFKYWGDTTKIICMTEPEEDPDIRPCWMRYNDGLIFSSPSVRIEPMKKRALWLKKDEVVRQLFFLCCDPLPQKYMVLIDHKLDQSFNQADAYVTPVEEALLQPHDEIMLQWIATEKRNV